MDSTRVVSGSSGTWPGAGLTGASIERLPRVVEHAGPFDHLVFFGRLDAHAGLEAFCRALTESARARGPLRKITFLGAQPASDAESGAAFIFDALADLPGIEITIVETRGVAEALEWLSRQPRTLVLASSVMGERPPALRDLFTRQIPFVSTRTGGIPELVGPANAHVLTEPTFSGIADLLARVHQDGRLAIDYRDRCA